MHGVNLLRICIKTDNPQPALALCEFAKMSGLHVSMNFTRASQINVNTLIDVAAQCEKASADIICIADSNGSLRPEQTSRHLGSVSALHFARHHDIVLSSGHTTKDQTLRLIEAVERVGGCRLMLNQPANPITGFSATELRAPGEYDWLYVEQCALTLYLGYQTPQDMYDVLTQVNNVVYSSDLGQPGQPDIGEWLEDSRRWFLAAGLSAERIDTVTRLNPLRMLDPVRSPD